MAAKAFDTNDSVGVGSSNIQSNPQTQAEWQKALAATVNVTAAATMTSVLSIPVPGPGRYKVVGTAACFNSSLGGGGNAGVLNLTDGTTIFGGAAFQLASVVGAVTTATQATVMGEIVETGPVTISMNVGFASANSGVGVGGSELSGNNGNLFTSSATQLFITKVSQN